MALSWQRLPTRDDPRLPVAAILLCYVVLGMTVLGFNRDPLQVCATVLAAVAFDFAFHRLLQGGPMLFPFSALITGLSLSILVNYAHGLWLAVIPAFFAIASKHVIRFRGRHVMNPALFGVVACLLLTDGMISDSPAYQWGGSYAIAAFVVTLALFFFVLRINRLALIGSFLVFYFLALLLRAYLTRWLMPMETWILGALTSPAFYLFTFFMITDPQTSPDSRRGQVLMALAIVALDFALHFTESLSTLFYAAFLCAAARLLWSHASAVAEGSAALAARLRSSLPRFALVGVTGSALWLAAHSLAKQDEGYEPGFELTAIDTAAAGVSSRPGRVLESVDPRIAHVAKWLLSVGDAIALADVDNDGRLDFFVTYPLKDARDRAALYRNLGDFRFQRLEIPALRVFDDPLRNGLPAGALFFDYDNDGDQDLLIAAGFGTTRLLQNRLVEDGVLAFADVTSALGLNEYTISVALNAADFDGDGRLDVVIGNVMDTHLPGYAAPTRFNVFRLPQPQYPGDRRMFNFMHRTWHDASNGGGMMLYRNRSGGFEKAAITDEKRWTIAIGAGDLDGDGLPDLYAANDFGPDQLLINTGDGRFRAVRGRLPGEIGRDTYKGMNVSFADFDNNGHADIYVSNVHEKLQAEGSLLWMNRGTSPGAAGWSDQAMARNALNEKRFGWGAAVGDLDRDGRIDILQANGMVDDAYDPGLAGCPDYWYWNDKIALTRPDVHGYADRWADLRGRCIFPRERDRVYLNRGRHFIDVAARVGWTKGGNSRGIALADLDNDGDLDVLVTHQFAPLSIYRNDENANATPKSWVGISLAGDGRSCNRDAVGSRVLLEYGARTQWRELHAANGFSAQGDRRLLFGLGEHSGPVRVRVQWCGAAAVETLTLATGRYHHLDMAARPEVPTP